MKKLFFFFFFFFSMFGAVNQALAWNEEYSQIPVSSSRTVCIQNAKTLLKGAEIKIHSVPPDEDCPEGEKRYRLLLGKDPKGSWALVPFQEMKEHFPPAVVSWPIKDSHASSKLWHFSCFASSKTEVLGFPTEQRKLKGEVTLSAREQSCESAAMAAETICREQFGGNELYENCYGGSQW